MTRALNEARAVVAELDRLRRDWPDAGAAQRVLRFDEPEPWPEREPEPEPAPVCRHTGLRRGDRVTRWPYTGDPAAWSPAPSAIARGGQVLGA